VIEKYLKGEERIILSLRSLYSKYGYLPYKMNKFEEYDLYAKNKDFLVSDSVITFTGTNGKLLALKPDVTLSIIKNATEEKGTKNKVFYNENVYRISGGTREYKEIMQMGLECIGDIGLYDTYEVISLAKNSLESISSDFVLEISHMGVVSGVLNKISNDEEFCKKALECIEKKSKHTLMALCEEYKISSSDTNSICDLASLYGTPDDVLEKLAVLEKSYDIAEYTSELKGIWELISADTNSDKIRFDFSIVNDMNYYNGIVINGFINGICECVLFGGNYDKLLLKMGKKCSGVGFAIYTDLLSSLNERPSAYDVDALVIYNESTTPKKLKATVDALISEGKSVSVQKSAPKKLRYKEKIDI
jgi:ATP phosphoribosyltransferase regulatory subunit